MGMLYRLLNMRGIHFFATRFAPRQLKAAAFDARHAEGPWLQRRSKQCGEFAAVVMQYARGGDILDLGCGAGGLVDVLAPGSYRSFTGVDISQVAIAVANQKGKENARFLNSDMLDFRPDRIYSLIIFEECLYYMRCPVCHQIIDKFLQYLAADGFALITTSDSQRYSSLLDMVRQKFTVCEDRTLANSARHLFVIRPSAQVRSTVAGTTTDTVRNCA